MRCERACTTSCCSSARSSAREQVNARIMSTFVSKDARELCRRMTNRDACRDACYARVTATSRTSRELRQSPRGAGGCAGSRRGDGSGATARRAHVVFSRGSGIAIVGRACARRVAVASPRLTPTKRKNGPTANSGQRSIATLGDAIVRARELRAPRREQLDLLIGDARHDEASVEVRLALHQSLEPGHAEQTHEVVRLAAPHAHVSLLPACREPAHAPHADVRFGRDAEPIRRRERERRAPAPRCDRSRADGGAGRRSARSRPATRSPAPSRREGGAPRRARRTAWRVRRAPRSCVARRPTTRAMRRCRAPDTPVVGGRRRAAARARTRRRRSPGVSATSRSQPFTCLRSRAGDASTCRTR